MSTTILTLAMTLTLCTVTWGHLCLLSPPQRGSMQGLNKPASPDCILLKAPCGGRDSPQEPQLVLTHGEKVVVVMQKNLDHFNKTSPGYFSISLMEAHGSAPSNEFEILRISDTSEPALTILAANATVTESVRPGHMILQARYVTNNPQAPPVFYQCADVRVVPRPTVPRSLLKKMQLV